MFKVCKVVQSFVVKLYQDIIKIKSPWRNLPNQNVSQENDIKFFKVTKV